ncbi:MAG: xanthine dehydrogenase family protein molybdopterin-binding subunit, partial [Pseudomonadota bacterium]
MVNDEFEPLVRGEGQYVDDLPFPDALHVAFVRCAYARAEILSIDLESAKDHAGVVAIFTAADAKELAPIRARVETNANSHYFQTDWHPIAKRHTRYVGEIVAMVIATDRYLAEDAAELVYVDYRMLQPVASAAKAKSANAPAVHDDCPDNLLYENRLGLAAFTGNVPDPSTDAFTRVRLKCTHPRLAGLSMENSGVVAWVRGGELHVWTSTQVPHLIRDGLSASLRTDKSRIRVIAPHVGGGFGPKMHLFPEEVLIAFAASRLDRPIKWIQDRAENLQASFHARDLTIDAELSADEKGRVIGLKARLDCDAGAYSAFPITSSLEPQTVGGGLLGPYRWQAYDYVGRAYATNKFPTGAYRGVGFPVGPLVTELLMDSLARALDRDPIDIRAANLLTAEELPYENLIGATYDSGHYADLLYRATERLEYSHWRRKQADAKATSQRLGIGIASFVESTGMGETVYRRRGMSDIPGFDAAQIAVHANGTVRALVSTPSQGQGQVTTFRTMLVQELGVAFEDIVVQLGDTAQTPYGSGTFASRSVVSGGGALIQAARQMKQSANSIAARLWQTSEDDVEFDSGEVRLKSDHDRRLSLAAIASEQADNVLTADAQYSAVNVPFACATHATVVEVDIDTGNVAVLRYVVAEDCGPIINQHAVDGQVRGAVAQGIGA